MGNIIKMKVIIKKSKFRIPTAKKGFDFKSKKGKGSYNRKKEKQVNWR